MKTLTFESSIKINKNSFTTVDELPEPWVKKPIMQKVIFGREIQTPTSYRIYNYSGMISRTWVFGDLEINPDRFNIDQVKK